MGVLSAESLKAARYVTARAKQLRALRWVIFQIEALMVLYLFVFAAFISAILLELQFHPWTVVFWLYNLLMLGLLAVLAVKVVLPMAFRKTSTVQVSAEIERQIPGLKQRLITAVELGKADERTLGLFAQGLLELFYEDARAAVRQSAAWWRVIRRESLLFLVLVAGTFWFLSSLPNTTFPLTARDLLHMYVNTLLRPPFDVAASLNVTPGDAIILTGTDIDIRAQLIGKEGGAVIRYNSEGFPPEEEPMRPENEGLFTYSFKSLQTPLSYRVIAGGMESKQHKISIALPPQLESLNVRVRPPAYSKLPEERLPDNVGNLDVLIGSTVHVNSLFDKPMREAALDVSYEGDAIADSTKVVMVKVGLEWTGSFIVSSTGSYTLSAKDEDGFDSKPVNYDIRIKPDALPKIRFVAPEADDVRPVDNSVAVSYEATDDIGVARVYLAWRIPGSATRTRVLAREEILGNTHVQADYTWDTSTLPPRNNFKFRLEAFDWAYLSRHTGKAFDPESDTRFAYTEEKYVIFDENIVYAEGSSSGGSGSDGDGSGSSSGDSEGSASASEGAANALPAPQDGTEPQPDPNQNPLTQYVQEAKQLAQEQRDLTREILNLQNQPIKSPQDQAKAQALAKKQEELTKKTEKLGERIKNEPNTPPNQTVSTEMIGKDIADPLNESVKNPLQANPDAARKLGHDLSRKELYRDEKGLVTRKGAGKSQDEVSKDLNNGRLDQASKKSLDAQEKLDQVARVLELMSKNESFEEELDKKKELAKADPEEKEKTEEEKATLEDEEREKPEDKEEEDKAEETKKEESKKPLAGTPARGRNPSGVSVAPEGMPDETAITATMAEGDIDPTLTDNPGLRIIDSKARKDEKTERANREERYPPKYIGMVEEYLRAAPKS